MLGRPLPSLGALARLALLLLGGALGAQPPAPASSAPSTPPDRHILMIDVGDPNRPAFVPFNSAFLARLRADSSIRTIVYREHHDPRVALDTTFDGRAIAIWAAR